MKNSHKQSIRVFIMELLYSEDIRDRLFSWEHSEKDKGLELNSFEAMEFYEKEVDRIDKMFFYPQSRNA
jgi:hypothetical protein